MGWEFAWKSRKELIAHLCDEPTDYKTLARKVTSERGESVLWAVHEIGPDDKENPGLRFIVCYLMRRNQPLIPLDTPWPNEQAHHVRDGGDP